MGHLKYQNSAAYIYSTRMFLFHNVKYTILNKYVKENWIFTEFNKGLYYVAEDWQEENEHFQTSIVLEYC